MHRNLPLTPKWYRGTISLNSYRINPNKVRTREHFQSEGMALGTVMELLDILVKNPSFATLHYLGTFYQFRLPIR